MQVKYYSENTNPNLEILGTAELIYSKTYSGHGLSSDGRQTFDAERDNVDFVVVTVWWSKAAAQQEPEDLKCSVPIREQDF